jgi:hypothetical protein
MIAVDPPVKILIFPLASEGPSTHAAVPLATGIHLGGGVLPLPYEFMNSAIRPPTRPMLGSRKTEK